MSLWQIAFLTACFGAGCILAARKARAQGMLGMVRLWTVLCVASFLACAVLIARALAK